MRVSIRNHRNANPRDRQVTPAGAAADAAATASNAATAPVVAAITKKQSDNLTQSTERVAKINPVLMSSGSVDYVHALHEPSGGTLLTLVCNQKDHIWV